MTNKRESKGWWRSKSWEKRGGGEEGKSHLERDLERLLIILLRFLGVLKLLVRCTEVGVHLSLELTVLELDGLLEDLLVVADSHLVVLGGGEGGKG